MSAWKLVALMIGWVLAAVAIAVVTAILLTELLVLIGVVDWGTPSYSWAINGLALVVFIPLVLVPVIFRKRFVEPPAETSDE
jgi:hypothetical protein